ncbi:MAG TPA: hypothetical protein VLF88_03455 [Candidatus Babeliales bacterium]|nr:hypothetical protein [Candidatus Babeliales bacterium]
MALRRKQTDNKVRSPKQSTLRQPLTTYYRSENKSDASPFVKKSAPHKSRKYFLGLLDVVLIIILVAAIGYSMLVSPKPRVIASDLSYRSQDAYQSAIAQQLSSLKNRNKISFNENSIADNLQRKFPEISAVNVELPFFSQQPVFRLKISRPSFVLNNQGQNYVISMKGVAVAKSRDFPDVKDLQTVTDQSSYKISPGTRVLDADSTNFISNLISQYKYQKIEAQSLVMPPKPQELDLRVKGQPYYVKFYLRGDVANQTGQYLAARKHFAESGQSPSEYLDVRVPGKIFYR